MWYKYCNNLIEEAMNELFKRTSPEAREQEFIEYEKSHQNEWDALQKMYFILHRNSIHRLRVEKQEPWEDILPWFKFKHWRKTLGL